jgi:arabinan endo-1,5-alpha-L-arabinosidase
MFSLRTQLLPALSILTTLLTTAAAYADPGACSSGCTNSHDPSIIRRASDGTYFRFSTGGTIQIHTAPDLSGPWAFACTMLPGAAKLRVPGNPGTDLWAPDVSRVGASYYVYYSVSAFGSQESGIGLATSDTMECGTWDDVGGVGVASSTGDPYNAIDAQLWDDGGTYRLQFGSFWDDLYQVPMRNPPTTSAGGAPVQLAYEPAGDRPEEGPFMVKNGGFYYLFFSWGKCCGYDKSRPAKGQEYRIKVCRSTSATGGFVSVVRERRFHGVEMLTCFVRSMRRGRVVGVEGGRLCWNRTGMSMVLEVNRCTMIPSMGGFWCITMWTSRSGMPMVTSGSDGIRSNGLVGGLRCSSSSSSIRNIYIHGTSWSTTTSASASSTSLAQLLSVSVVLGSKDFGTVFGDHTTISQPYGYDVEYYLGALFVYDSVYSVYKYIQEHGLRFE